MVDFTAMLFINSGGYQYYDMEAVLLVCHICTWLVPSFLVRNDVRVCEA